MKTQQNVTLNSSSLKFSSGFPFTENSTHPLLDCNTTKFDGFISPSIHFFPNDLLTQEQRRSGGIILHILATMYICCMMGILSSFYLMPSLQILSKKLKFADDVENAILIAIGASIPDLFSVIFGTFVGGEIGLGDVIGSSAFSLIAITGIVALFMRNQVLDLEIYPVARDWIVYALSLCILSGIIADDHIKWWEPILLLIVFISYVFTIYYNEEVEKRFNSKITWISENTALFKKEEKETLCNEEHFAPEITEYRTFDKVERDSYSVEITATQERNVLQKPSYIDEILQKENIHSTPDIKLCTPPSDRSWKFACWLVTFPARLIFAVSIPDAHNGCCYPLTFFLSVLWIGLLTYSAMWMSTIIGYTILIPNSLLGISVLAVCISLPEVPSSVSIAEKGQGNAVISCLLGSNIINICFTVGVTWQLQTLLIKDKAILVNSSILIYVLIMLLCISVIFILCLITSKWKLTQKIGLTFLLMYLIFIVSSYILGMDAISTFNSQKCRK